MKPVVVYSVPQLQAKVGAFSASSTFAWLLDPAAAREGGTGVEASQARLPHYFY